MKKIMLPLLVFVVSVFPYQQSRAANLDERCPSTLSSDQLTFFRKCDVDKACLYSNAIQLRGADTDLRLFRITDSGQENFLRVNPRGLKKVIAESFRLVHTGEDIFKTRKVLVCTYGRKSVLGSSEHQFEIFSFLDK